MVSSIDTNLSLTDSTKSLYPDMCSSTFVFSSDTEFSKSPIVILLALTSSVSSFILFVISSSLPSSAVIRLVIPLKAFTTLVLKSSCASINVSTSPLSSSTSDKSAFSSVKSLISLSCSILVSLISLKSMFPRLVNTFWSGYP